MFKKMKIDLKDFIFIPSEFVNEQGGGGGRIPHIPPCVTYARVLYEICKIRTCFWIYRMHHCRQRTLTNTARFPLT